jgi:hypothetical protein
MAVQPLDGIRKPFSILVNTAHLSSPRVIFESKLDAQPPTRRGQDLLSMPIIAHITPDAHHLQTPLQWARQYAYSPIRMLCPAHTSRVTATTGGRLNENTLCHRLPFSPPPSWAPFRRGCRAFAERDIEAPSFVSSCVESLTALAYKSLMDPSHLSPNV